MKALVTGATGFIGSHLAAHLERQGWEVAAAPSGGAPAARAAGLVDAVARIAPDAVFHLAGLTRAAHPAMLYDANVVLTAHLLTAAARQTRPPVIVLTGSAAEYGPISAAAGPVAETCPCTPVTDYGISKYAQTLMGLARAAAGLPVIIARLWNPVGRGLPEHFALASFAAQIAAIPKTGGTLHVGDLEARRDLIDVREAARLMAALATRADAIGQVVNICSGAAYRLRDLVAAMIALAGRPVSVVTDPARLRPDEAPVLYGDTGRLARLGLTPAPPDFAAILPELLAARSVR